MGTAGAGARLECRLGLRKFYHIHELLSLLLFSLPWTLTLETVLQLPSKIAE